MPVRDGAVASRFFRRLTTIAGLLLLCAVGAAAILTTRPALAPSWWPGRPPLADLVAAVGAQRPFEPRLTGGFAYAPVSAPSATRSAAPGDSVPSTEIRIAALTLEKRLESNRSAATLGAFGAASLVTGRSDAAVRALEEAVRLEPRAAKLHSDLAAAYLVRFKQRNELEDVARAVDVAARAAASDPTLVEARFNLALGLESLSLRHEAREAWMAYARLDRHSSWAGEAQEHLDALAPQTLARRFDEERQRVVDAAAAGDQAAVRAAVVRFPDVAYNYVENDLIPDWADAWLARDRANADGILRRARQVALAVAEAVDERLPVDAVSAIEREVSAPVDRADALARGHQWFRKARKAYQAGDTASFADDYRRAREALRGSQSPYEEWTRLYLAIADYYRSDLRSAAAPLTPLLAEATTRRHWYVAGRTSRMRGLLSGISGNLSGQLDDYNSALAAFDRLRARSDAAGIHASLADTYESLGDHSATWSHIRDALAGLGDVRLFGTRTTVLWRAALKATRDDLLHAAILLNTEFLDEAQSAAPPVDTAQGFLNRAAVYDQLGLSDRAQADLQAATESIARITDAGIRSRIAAEASLVRGEFAHTANPAATLASLQESVEYFRQSGMDLRLLRGYLALGRVQSATGRTTEAAATFRAGIDVLERQRARLPSGEVRLGYFDLPWTLYDDAVELESRRHDRLDGAAALAERARARDLLEVWSGSADARPVDPLQLSNTLPPHTALAYFVSLPRSLLLWVVRPDRTTFFRMAVGAGDLAANVAAFRTAIERNDAGGSARLAESLFRDLLSPALDALKGIDVLVVAPDGPLHALPFAALIDPATGHRLIEDRAVATTPSATILARNARSRRSPLANAAVLVVGNPQIDRRDAVGLPSLTDAGLEAVDVGNVYADAVVLTGNKATKRAFLRNAGRFDIVHFAGHALANDRYPMLSRLLLARESSDDPGVLFAHEILEADLSRTSLVVLAACGTAVGPIKKGEGAIGLARPFLARGVPAVVATLWDVDDRASRLLFQTFYQALHAGESPTRALRAAQLDLFRRQDPELHSARAWAAFTAIGGLDDVPPMTRFDGGQR